MVETKLLWPDFSGGREGNVTRGVGILPFLLRCLGAYQGTESCGQVAAEQGFLGWDVQQQSQGLRAETRLQNLQEIE